MKSLLAVILIVWAGVAFPAEDYARVVGVKPHYVKPACTGCVIPEQMGYDVWLDYRDRIIAARTDHPVRVGDKWEVKERKLVGKPIPRNEAEHRRPFPSNASDN